MLEMLEILKNTPCVREVSAALWVELKLCDATQRVMSVFSSILQMMMVIIIIIIIITIIISTINIIIYIFETFILCVFSIPFLFL